MTTNDTFFVNGRVSLLLQEMTCSRVLVVRH